MLISKGLEGATVQRVYWAVPSRDWLPVVGEQFDTLRHAQDHADTLMDETGQDRLTIVSRMVFIRPDSVVEDIEVDREVRFR